ncbi:post-embryonic retina morphogenesis in camera-type eye [Branchiostoma belcheri]|nr:post-embryonic retina morphogenesis in camera-type eye [Branchiostoma belcheri]
MAHEASTGIVIEARGASKSYTEIFVLDGDEFEDNNPETTFPHLQFTKSSLRVAAHKTAHVRNLSGNLAVQIHDGKPGIFPVRGQPQPKKKKKDIYLSKQNKHPLRRPAQEEPANENKDGGPTSNQNQAKKTRPANRKPPPNPNPRTKRGKDDGKGTKNDGKAGEGTVTLTQQQLNAILASIGKATDTSSAVNVQIENNEVKIVSNENGPQTSGETSGPTDGSGDAGQAVISGQSDPPADLAPDQPAKAETTSPGEETVQGQEQPRTEPTAQQQQQQQQPDNNTHSTKQQSSYGGLLSTIGKEEEDKRTAAESRKAQLRRELEEQIADKKRRDQQARDRSAVERARPVEDYVPWGRPGAGAPLRSQSGKVVAEYGDTRRSPGQSEPAPTSQAHLAVSTVPPPHAMRSSFAIGGAAPGDDQYVTTDQDEKRRWLQELEKQREEARQRKQRERQRDKEGGGMDAWTRHFDTYHPTAREPPTARADAPPPVPEPHPQPAQSPTPGAQDAVVQETDHHTTPRTSLERRNFLRTGAALKDPAQLEELERRRLKDLEHKVARLTRLTDGPTESDPGAGGRTTAGETGGTQTCTSFDCKMHKSEYRVLSELLNQKTKLLFESMQQAEQQALQEKRQQRMRHLERHGHDVTNLRHTFESTEPQLSYRSSHPGEVPPLQGLSPREQFGVIHSRRDPPPHPGASYHSPREADQPPVSYISSPRRETAVQTDPFRLPDEVPVTMPEEGDSSSVEIEYRDSREQQRSRQNRDPAKHGKKEASNRRAAATDSEKENSRTKRKSEKPAEKPRWGASSSKVQGKKFVKASERYPNKLKKKREENLVKRERELKKQMEANSKERLRQRMVEQRSSPEVTGRKSPPVPTLAGKNKNKDDDDLYAPYERTSRKPKRQEAVRVAQEFRSDSPPVPALRKKAEGDGKEQSFPPQQRGEVDRPNVRGQRAWDGGEPGQYDYDSAPRANSPPVPALRSKTKQPGPDRERNPRQSPERSRNPIRSPSKSPDRKPKVRQKSPESRYGTSNSHPHSPLRDGDFIPFRRTDDGVLDPQEPMSLPETREAPRLRRRASTDHSPHRGGGEQVPDNMRSASAGQTKDPLLNPGMVKNPQRQEQILKQLKSLREGLLMRQREIESCMSPPITAFQPDLQNPQHGPQ